MLGILDNLAYAFLHHAVRAVLVMRVQFEEQSHEGASSQIGERAGLLEGVRSHVRMFAAQLCCSHGRKEMGFDCGARLC